MVPVGDLRKRLPRVLLRLAQRPLRQERGGSRPVDEVEDVDAVVREHLQGQLEERLGLVRSALEHEAEPETGRPGREEALLAELLENLARLAQHGLGGREVSREELDVEALLGRPGGGNRKPELLEHRDAFLPALTRLVEAPREREERALLDARDRLDLSRRRLLENVAAAGERSRGGRRSEPAADQQPVQDLCLVAPAARAPRAGEASVECLVARFPLPEADQPEQKPRAGEPEIVTVTLEDWQSRP